MCTVGRNSLDPQQLQRPGGSFHSTQGVLKIKTKEKSRGRGRTYNTKQPHAFLKTLYHSNPHRVPVLKDCHKHQRWRTVSSKILKPFVKGVQESTFSPAPYLQLKSYRKIKPGFQLLFASGPLALYKGNASMISLLFGFSLQQILMQKHASICMPGSRRKGLSSVEDLLIACSFYVQKHTVRLSLQSTLTEPTCVFKLS